MNEEKGLRGQGERKATVFFFVFWSFERSKMYGGWKGEEKIGL